MDTIQLVIEELCLSGEVGIGECSRSTLYRHARQINERLEREKYDWRVMANIPNMSIVAI